MSAKARLLLFLGCGAFQLARADDLEEFWLSYGHHMQIRGFKPPGKGHPLYIWLTGTTMQFNTPADRGLTKAMAQGGYVAAQVQYPNLYYHDTCAWMDQQASPIFQGQGSALELLCLQPYVSCSKGVAVHGFSLGANIASLAPNYDRRITALLLFGNGNFVYGAYSNRHRRLSLSAVRSSHRCLRYDGPPHHAIGRNKVRSIVGGRDEYFGSDVRHVAEQQAITTGYNCGSATNCVQPDGSGYYIITSPESFERHDFFVRDASSDASKLRKDFKHGSEPWCMKPCLSWLAGAALTAENGPGRAAAAFELEQLPLPSRRGLAPAMTATAAALATLVLAGLALALRARHRGEGPREDGEKLLSVELQEAPTPA